MSAHAGSRHPARYKRRIFAELLLVTEIQLIILVARWISGGEATLLLDGALMFVGLFATAFFLVRRAGIWFVLCGLLPIAAGLIQLSVSFGVEWVILASVTVLLLADMVANLILLGISLWQRSYGRGGG